MPSFDLHPRLESDTVPVCDLPLSAVRLMDDARYAWLVLVPRRAGLTEIIDLDAAGRATLMEEIALASRALWAEVPCDKLNVAALGNQVAQLHIHVIARRIDDAAWPGPVWGTGSIAPYDPAVRDDLAARLRERLGSSQGA